MDLNALKQAASEYLVKAFRGEAEEDSPALIQAAVSILAMPPNPIYQAPPKPIIMPSR